MGAGDGHGHYVSTRKQAEQIINRRKRFWISDCGCRKGMGAKCKRSRMDVCLGFGDPGPKGSSGGGASKEVSRRFVEGVLKEAEAKHLVCRPFNYGSRKAAQGICFCCDDCCAFFISRKARGHDRKGTLIESTNFDTCIHCGKCVKACTFGARAMKRRKLHVDRRLCAGCGLCLDVCPVDDCIEMVKRPMAAGAH